MNGQRTQYRGLSGAHILYGQRLKKKEGKLYAFDIERDSLDEYAGMAIESARPGEQVRYI